MEQPEGFVAPGQAGKVCRLVKSLYGLKQAPMKWHEKFDHVVFSNAFKANECDSCVYYKEYHRDNEEGYVMITLYVDDLLIAGSNDKVIKSTKDMLKSRFDMKDMGLADVILGMKISRTSEGLALSQPHYVDKILERFCKDDNETAKNTCGFDFTSIQEQRCRSLPTGILENHWKSDVLNELYKTRHRILNQ